MKREATYTHLRLGAFTVLDVSDDPLCRRQGIVAVMERATGPNWIEDGMEVRARFHAVQIRAVGGEMRIHDCRTELEIEPSIAYRRFSEALDAGARGLSRAYETLQRDATLQAKDWFDEQLAEKD